MKIKKTAKAKKIPTIKRKLHKVFRMEEVLPKCPDCGNRHGNKRIRGDLWKCASCFTKFSGKINKKPIQTPKQIGVDVEDGDEFEDY